MTTSRSLNKVIIIGNLTRDPVVKQVGEKGSTVCTFGIATNSVWRDSQGNVQERTEFHHVVAWNKLGEICAQLLSTGMLVYLEGELRTRTWDDEKGTRHYRVEIKLNDMKLLDGKGKKGIGMDVAVEEGGKTDDHLVMSLEKDVEEEEHKAEDDGDELF